MKKTKLFLSIISLCFSLAVLTFGIYALNQYDYSIKGDINFNITDAFVEITTDVYKYGDYSGVIQNAPTKNAELVSFYSSGHLEKISSSDYKQDSRLINGDVGNLTPTNLSSLDLSLNTKDKKAIYISIHIKNIGTDTVYTRVDSCVLRNLTDNSEIDFALSNFMKYLTAGQTIASGETKEMLFAISVEDFAVKIQDLKFEYNLNISSNVYRNEFLKYDSLEHYYYVELGYTSANQPLRWKLVSTDGGVTKYTAPDLDTNDICHPSGDCVFVQEVAMDSCQVFLNETKYNIETLYHIHEKNKDRLANDYWSSDIRFVIQDASIYGYQSQQNANQDSLYQKIQKRNIHNLYSNMFDETLNYVNTPNNVSGKKESDMFWLLSYEETENLLDSYNYLNASGDYAEYFLRTPAEFGNGVYNYGPGDEGIGICFVHNSYKKVRSAFMLSI